MKVSIGCIRIVDMVPWPVTVEVPLSQKTRSERAIALDKVLRSLAKSGFLSGIVDGEHAQTPPTPQLNAPEPVGVLPVGVTMSQAASLLKPVCKVHGAEMEASKVQKEEGKISYYCTKRLGQDGYCRSRASVDARTSQPSFWEVKA